MDAVSIGLLIAYIILIVMSAFFSATETAYTAVNRVRLRTYAAAGNRKAQNALKMVEKHDKLLSTMLVGNNIVNITLTTIGTIFYARIILNNENLSVVISTISTTLLVLLFGEITPKSLASEKPEAMCMALNPIVTAVYYFLVPLNAIFVLWKKLLTKVFKLERGASVTEDELKTYVDTAESGGEIDEHERKLIRSAIEFDDLDVYDIMTPRVNVIAINETESLEEVSSKFRDNEFSRLPVYSESIDSIIGIVHEKDLFLNARGEFNLKSILQPSICLSKNMKISAALRVLQKAKVHMAVVVDEYGGTSGIVTMEDIIEELVGEIWDEHDEEEVLIRRADDDTFIVSGSENLDSMFDALGLYVQEDFESTSVGGWVTEQMEKIPVAGESFEFQNLTIIVLKATVKRVVEIKVKISPPEEEKELSQRLTHLTLSKPKED